MPFSRRSAAEEFMRHSRLPFRSYTKSAHHPLPNRQDAPTEQPPPRAPPRARPPLQELQLPAARGVRQPAAGTERRGRQRRPYLHHAAGGRGSAKPRQPVLQQLEDARDLAGAGGVRPGRGEQARGDGAHHAGRRRASQCLTGKILFLSGARARCGKSTPPSVPNTQFNSLNESRPEANPPDVSRFSRYPHRILFGMTRMRERTGEEE